MRHALLVCALLVGATAQAWDDTADQIMLLRTEQRANQNFNSQMQRINAVDAEMNALGQCILKSDRDWRRLPDAEKARFEKDQWKKDAINDCCMDHACKGI